MFPHFTDGAESQEVNRLKKFVDNIITTNNLNNLVFSSASGIPSIADVDNTFDQVVSLCHIRVQQRKKRKYITIIESLPDDLDLKRVLKALKKTLQCNGHLREDKDGLTVICLQGDQREKSKDFLIKYNIFTNEEIKVHGF